MKIEFKNPAALSVHPALKSIPPLDEAELKNWRAGLAEDDDRVPPLVADARGRLLTDSSRSWWLCAKARGLESVPVTTVDEADAPVQIIRDLAHRRRFTLGAVAYLAYPHFAPAFARSKLRRAANLRHAGANAAVDAPEFSTVEDLAAALGVGRNLFFQAKKVHELFADENLYPVRDAAGKIQRLTLKEFFEPKILRAPTGGEHESERPVGLGGVIAGVAAVKEGRRDVFSPAPNDPVVLVSASFGRGILRRCEIWSALSPAERRAAREQIEKQAAAMPPEKCETAARVMLNVSEIYQAAARARAKKMSDHELAAQSA